MPLEKDGFRDQLIRLDARFQGREVITMDEASKLLGRSRRVLLADKKFPVKRASKNGTIMIPLVGLARWLS